ncbi:MAG: RluA family pseudouridine synthase [Polyangiaceae bacterium]|nr:RluA family pseudouridine synthase [Polyangiaceae bacterium]
MTRLRVHELEDKPIRPAEVDERAVVTVLRVPPECAGMRLDRFVQSQLKRTSRTRAQVIIKRGAYSPDARLLRPSDRVRAEQRILLWRAPWDEEVIESSLPVLFEDDALLAIDKPPGVPVHPTARYYRSTVVKMLEAERPGERHFLAHRIDRETSGVLLLSKVADADRHVKKQFAGIDPRTDRAASRRMVDKTYLAIVHGWPDANRFVVDRPLEEDDTSRLRVKMRCAPEGRGLVATTRCSVRARRIRPSTGARYALVACELETGRQHQIRVHMASTGHALVGDKLYGPDENLHARGADGELTDEDHAMLEIPRHALHAHELELDHPSSGTRLKIVSPLPSDLAAFWDELDEAAPATTGS